MPENRKKNFPLVLSDEGRAALDMLAALQKRPVADVIRDAIGDYLHKYRIEVNMTVQRGGARKKEAAE